MTDNIQDNTQDNIHDNIRDHMSIMFVGHVDCGKSSISGNLLYLTGMVDKREIEKLKREAKQKGRESWFYAYIMDQNNEEKERGKTVEVGRAIFNTKKRRYTILDAPGHKEYITNMITTSAHADLAVLVVSARKGEFESGFNKGGQTREHVLIAKTLNVKKLIVLVNKMDEKTVKWSKERYDFIVKNLDKYLRKIGFKNIKFIPISGLLGDNLIDQSQTNLKWYYDTNGKSFIQELDDVEIHTKTTSATKVNKVNEHNKNNAICTIFDRIYLNGYTKIMTKVEHSNLKKGDKLNLYPINKEIKINKMESDFDDNLEFAKKGELINILTKEISPDEIRSGYVLGPIFENDPLSPFNPLCPCLKFIAKIRVMDTLDSSPIITVGSKMIMHLGTLTVDVEFDRIINKKKKCFLKNGDSSDVVLKTEQTICCSTFSNFRFLSTFLLRDYHKTIAIGKIIKKAKN